MPRIYKPKHFGKPLPWFDRGLLPKDMPEDSVWLAQRNAIIYDEWLQHPTGSWRRILEENATSVRTANRVSIERRNRGRRTRPELQEEGFDVDRLDATPKPRSTTGRSLRAYLDRNVMDRDRGQGKGDSMPQFASSADSQAQGGRYL